MVEYKFTSFIKYLERGIISCVKEILSNNGYYDIDVYVFSKIKEDRYVKMKISCDEYVFEIPEIDFDNSVSVDNGNEYLKEFYNSSARFVAYELLGYKGVVNAKI